MSYPVKQIRAVLRTIHPGITVSVQGDALVVCSGLFLGAEIEGMLSKAPWSLECRGSRGENGTPLGDLRGSRHRKSHRWVFLPKNQRGEQCP